MGIDDARCRRGGKQHECELAALRHQHATVQRLAMVATHQPRHAIDTRALAHHQGQHARRDQAPIGRNHAQIQAHADTQEKQPQQDAAKRFDIRFDLMPECGFRQQHAGQKGAHRHRQPAHLHQQCRAQHHQQRGSGHHLARLGGSQDAKQRIEQPTPGYQQANDAGQTDADALPTLRCGLRVAAGPHPGHDRQQRHDQQIFEQQDRHDLLPRRQGDVTALGQQLHHHRGGGQHKTGRRHEGHRERKAEQHADAGQRQRANRDLQRAKSEDFLA